MTGTTKVRVRPFGAVKLNRFRMAEVPVELFIDQRLCSLHLDLHLSGEPRLEVLTHLLSRAL